MNEAMDTAGESPGSLRRRDFLTKAAAAGAVAWAAPVILSRPAYALEGGEGTPKCKPSIKLCCTRYYCGQSNKYFPGIHILVGHCPCADDTCAVACVKIVDITHNPGNFAIVAWGSLTTCGSMGVDQELSTGDWECIGSSTTVFFGKRRGGNGAIGELGSNQEITFTLGVWAGGCPDHSPQDGGAYDCQTHSITITWDNANNLATCTCSDADSLCEADDFAPCVDDNGDPCPTGTNCEPQPTCPPSVEPPATQIPSTQINC